MTTIELSVEWSAWKTCLVMQVLRMGRRKQFVLHPEHKMYVQDVSFSASLSSVLCFTKIHYVTEIKNTDFFSFPLI